MLFQPFICFFWISYFIVFIYFVLRYLQAFWYATGEYIKVLQNMSSTYVVLFPFVLWANIRIIATVGRPVVPPSLGSTCSVLSDSNIALYHDAVHIFGVNLMYLLCLHFPLDIRHCVVMYLTTFSHSNMQGSYYYPHYTDEKTEVQDTRMTSPGSHRWNSIWIEVSLIPKPVCFSHCWKRSNSLNPFVTRQDRMFHVTSSSPYLVSSPQLIKRKKREKDFI